MDHQKCHIWLLLLQSDFWLLILPSQLTVNQNSDHVLTGKKLAAGEARYDTFGGPDCTNEAKKLAARGARYDTFGSPDCTLTFFYHVINWLIILGQFLSD